MKKSILLITLFLLALTTGVALAQQPAVACESAYTVQPGDWLGKVAAQTYGDAALYPAIAAATNANLGPDYTNFIAANNLILPGWTLCLPSHADAAALAASATDDPATLSVDDLQNATYTEYADAAPVTLVNDEYRQPVPDSAGEEVYTLADTFAFADFDGDGSEDALAVLISDAAGTGRFFNLMLLLNKNGVPTQADSAFLGDRSPVKAINIVGGNIYLDYVTQGPNDAACCATQATSQKFRVENGKLVTDEASIRASQTSEALTREKLWNIAYPIDEGEQITFVNGKYVGQPAAADDPSHPAAEMLAPLAFGDLTGDGVEDAVATFSYSGGGSGDFIYLAAVEGQGANPVAQASLWLDTAGKINGVAIDNGQVQVDMLRFGPGDAECCATEHAVVTYTLQDGALVEGEAQVITPATAASEAAALTVAELQNATYSGIYDEKVTLTNGKYEGEPFSADSPLRPTVTLLDNGIIFGDLNSDGIDDAAVFLVENSGGTGQFVYVSAQLNQNGQPVEAGFASLGDRSAIKSATIENNQVVAEIVAQGPGDGACCPTLKVRATYALQDGKLAEVSSQELGKISAVDLNGTTWTLVDLNFDQQPALADTLVTTSFQDGQISGSGGCNSYTGSFALAEDNPFGMTISPVAATKKACPDPILNQETAYFTALEKVSQWGYQIGRLVMYYNKGQSEFGTLLFTPPAAETSTSQLDMLTGLTWQWIRLTDPVQQFDLADPENYTIVFNPDGTVKVKADCNNVVGAYTADDSGSLTIEIGPMTKAMCPPGSRSDEFVQNLGFVRNFFMENGFVYLDLIADGGTLQLAPAPEALPAESAPASSDAWEAVSCDTFGLPATVAEMSDCGYVTVPELHSQPDGPTIQLAVVRTRSTGENPAPDPLFMEQGGPGGSTLDIYPAVALTALPNMKTLLKTRDLVFVEQRGTRHSKPGLLCPEQTAANVATLQGLQDKDDVSYLQACYDRLQAEGVNFDAFNTVQNAADMYAVAEVLGYNAFNYYGVSYGTLLGQYVIAQANEQPVQLRSAIIDAVVAPDVDFNGKSGDTASYALRNIFSGCAQDELCNRAFPNLESVFLGLVEQLNRQPITVTVTVPEDVRAAVPNAPVTIAATVTGAEFADVSFQHLYSMDKGRILPRHIYAAAKNNDFSWVAQGLADGLKADTATGMYFTMLCSRQNSVTSDGDFFGAPYPQLAYKDDDSDFFRGCQIFDVDPEGDAFTFADNSTPTLILNGANDPITPQPYGAYVGSKLQTAYVYTFPGMGHGAILDSPCAATIAVTFLADPTQGPESSCLSSLKPVFYGFPTPLEQLTLVTTTLPGSVTLALPSQWTLGSMGLYTDPNDPVSFATGGVLVAFVAGKSPAETAAMLGSNFKEIARDQAIGDHSWLVLEETQPGLVITHVGVAADEAADGSVLVQMSAAPATAEAVFAALWEPILSSVSVAAVE